MEEISDLELVQFSSQNVINSLDIEKQRDSYRFKLSPSYGLAGYIEARSIRLEFEPGIPPESKNRFKTR